MLSEFPAFRLNAFNSTSLLPILTVAIYLCSGTYEMIIVNGGVDLYQNNILSIGGRLFFNQSNLQKQFVIFGSPEALKCFPVYIIKIQFYLP